MKKKEIILIFILLLINLLIMSDDMRYPFIHIPGMFDNGDLLNSDYLLVKNLNNEDGYYYKKYFINKCNYNKEKFICSSNIVNSKYERLIVANLIGNFRTNISIWLMADRLFCLMQGRAPRFKNYKQLINYKGNDFEGSCTRTNITVYFKGLIEEVWAKYGKKVYYIRKKNRYCVILDPDKFKKTSEFYINENSYFDSPEQIKFNFVVHSSGGIALRRYIQMCEEEGLNSNINTIINLSVPQRGARMMYRLKNGFPALISDTMESFFKKIDSGNVEILYEGETYKISYKELVDKTKVIMLNGNSLKAKNMRNLIGNYILYNIPFDGRKNVLGRDPALYDLHPDHRLIKKLNKASLPENITVYNYRVKHCYSVFFGNLGKYLGLLENDGVVDIRDTELNHIPASDKFKIEDIFVEKANHIPFPYIKPVFELEKTVEEYYSFLKILLKVRVSKKEEIILIYALMKAIMQEMGLDIGYILKNENYSVIDYFAENPLDILN